MLTGSVEPYLYVGRTVSVGRIHVAGSQVEYLASVASPLRELAADASAVYYVQGGAPTGAFGMLPGLEAISYKPGGQFIAPTAGGIFVASPSGTLSSTYERVVRSGNSLSTTVITTGGPPGMRITADASNIYSWAATSASFGQHFINKIALSGGALTTLYLESSATIEDVASDGTNVYFTQSMLQGPNGIYRVLVVGGAAVLVVSVPAGRPKRLMFDGVNVYFLARSVDAAGNCLSSTISRVAKTGGTVTPIWGMNKTCPTVLAAASTGIFFDTGGLLRRSPK